MNGNHRERLYAGMAKVSITPSTEDIKGYRQFISGGFLGVRQEIYARILALQAGTRTALIISLELIAMPDYLEFREKLAKAYGLKPTDIIMGGTQNHQCIVPDSFRMEKNEKRSDICKHVIEEIHAKIFSGVGEALSKMIPAQIGWETGYSYINTNYDYSSSARAKASGEEYANRELFVMRVDSEDGKPMGCLLNYCLMGTMMAANYDNWICGDIHGQISAGIEAEMGDGFTALYLIGGSANAKPLIECNYETKRIENGKLVSKRVDLPLEAREMLRDVLASRQIKDAMDIYDRIVCKRRFFYFRSAELFDEVDAREIPFFNKAADNPERRDITGTCMHKLHLLSLGDELVFACANSITSMKLDQKVRNLLPVKTVFVSVEGRGIGYVMDADSDDMCDGNMHSLVYSNEENEAIYKHGFMEMWEKAL